MCTLYIQDIKYIQYLDLPFFSISRYFILLHSISLYFVLFRTVSAKFGTQKTPYCQACRSGDQVLPQKGTPDTRARVRVGPRKV